MGKKQQIVKGVLTFVRGKKDVNIRSKSGAWLKNIEIWMIFKLASKHLLYSEGGDDKDESKNIERGLTTHNRR